MKKAFRAVIGICNMQVDIETCSLKNGGVQYLKMNFSNMTDAAGETTVTVFGVSRQDVEDLAAAMSMAAKTLKA